MKKIFTTILTVAVLGGGYVGANAFAKEATVRQNEAWYPVDGSGDALSGEAPISVGDFNASTNCPQTTQMNCAALFAQDQNGNPTDRISEIVLGEFTR